MISVSALRARIDRDLDLAAHVGGRDHAAVRRVAAFLRHLLILDLDRLHARGLVAAHGLPHVDEPAEAGIGIGDQRHAGAVRDRARALHHVAIGDEAGVGDAEIGARHAVAGHVERGKADAVGDARGEHVEHAGRDDERAALQNGLQSCLGHSILMTLRAGAGAGRERAVRRMRRSPAPPAAARATSRFRCRRFPSPSPACSRCRAARRTSRRSACRAR